MRRVLVPEILDSLAPEDPSARASRRDLRRINGLMFHALISASLVRDHSGGPLRRVVDLGCGDGLGALAVLRRIGAAARGGELFLIDAQPSVAPATSAELSGLGWHMHIVKADVFDWLEADAKACDLIMANLFLHHFESPAIIRLLHGIAAHTGLFIATEPLRRRFAYLAASAVGLIGANAVTRHDAPASVRAGFNGPDLGPTWPGTVLFEGRRGLFTHAFAARGTL